MHGHEVVCEDGAHGKHPARTQPGERARSDKAFDTLREGAPERGQGEDGEREEVDGAAADEVGEAGVEGERGDVGYEEGGREPGCGVGGVEVGGYVWVRGGHHCAVETGDLRGRGLWVSR